MGLEPCFAALQLTGSRCTHARRSTLQHQRTLPRATSRSCGGRSRLQPELVRGICYLLQWPFTSPSVVSWGGSALRKRSLRSLRRWRPGDQRPACGYVPLRACTRGSVTTRLFDVSVTRLFVRCCRIWQHHFRGERASRTDRSRDNELWHHEAHPLACSPTGSFRRHLRVDPAAAPAAAAVLLLRWVAFCWVWAPAGMHEVHTLHWHSAFAVRTRGGRAAAFRTRGTAQLLRPLVHCVRLRVPRAAAARNQQRQGMLITPQQWASTQLAEC